MHVKEKGHVYQLANRNPDGKSSCDEPAQTIVFVNAEPGNEHPGTTTQEVLRALLDRTRHCNNCLPHPNNERIVWHLRMALALHETRAIERAIDRGELEPEYVATGRDGHFLLPMPDTMDGNLTTRLEPWRNDWERVCNHPKHEKRKTDGKSGVLEGSADREPVEGRADRRTDAELRHAETASRHKGASGGADRGLYASRGEDV